MQNHYIVLELMSKFKESEVYGAVDNHNNLVHMYLNIGPGLFLDAHGIFISAEERSILRGTKQIKFGTNIEEVKKQLHKYNYTYGDDKEKRAALKYVKERRPVIKAYFWGSPAEIAVHEGNAKTLEYIVAFRNSSTHKFGDTCKFSRDDLRGSYRGCSYVKV